MPILKEGTGVDLSLVGGELSILVEAGVMLEGEDAALLGSGAATDGYVLTADGLGAAAWEAAPATSTTDLEKVAGESGFVAVSGAVTLDLSLGRAFHHEIVGDITSASFASVPSATTTAAVWSWVLWNSSGTTTFSLSSPPSVEWIDGSSWSDLDLTPGATNIVTFWQVGTVTRAVLNYTGEIPLDPYKVCFIADGTILIVSEAEDIDVASATKPSGDGAVSYTKNGAAITTRTTFAGGDVLGVVCSGLTATTTVRIPRYA